MSLAEIATEYSIADSLSFIEQFRIKSVIHLIIQRYTHHVLPKLLDLMWPYDSLCLKRSPDLTQMAFTVCRLGCLYLINSGVIYKSHNESYLSNFVLKLFHY